MSRMTADTAVGMMDAAYFTGRKELLDFFNELLSLNLLKIEQTASGAVACQMTELIFPGSIPLSKIDWSARTDYEYVQNYKLLQIAFNKHHIQRYIDVDKLIRAKYQDNLEFCQWLKAFYDQSGSSRDGYDPIAARAKGKGGKQYNVLMGKKGASSSSSSIGLMRGTSAKSTTTATSTMSHRNTTAVSSSRTGSGVTVRSTGAPSMMTKSSATTRRPIVDSTRPLRERNSPVAATSRQANISSNNGNREQPTTTTSSSAVADAILIKKNAELLIKNDELEQAIIDIEKERDFYFEKLRNVEVMLQIYQERDNKDVNDQYTESLIENVFKVLYATSDDNVTVNEDGEAIPNTSLSSPNGMNHEEDEQHTQQHDDEDDDDLLFSDADHQHHNTPMLHNNNQHDSDNLFADCEQH